MLEPSPHGSAVLAGPRAFRPAAIRGVGMAVPPQVLENESIAARLGIDPSWIVERTGIESRRIIGEGESLLDLAVEAALKALAAAALEPEEIDLLLVATMSHDRLTPNLASLLGARIGSEAGAVDIGAACSGFVDGLALAAGYVESGRAKTILLVGAEQLSALTDRDDRATAALFGDGAGAVVVTAGEGAGIGPFVLGSDGARSALVWATRDEALIRMEGQDTFREAVRRLSAATTGAAQAAGLELDEIDLFVYHQANGRILRAVTNRLGLSEQRVVECISRFGNTSAASIPIALATALEQGRIEPGDQILLAAFGGGLSWGAAVIEWEGDDAP